MFDTDMNLYLKSHLPYLKQVFNRINYNISHGDFSIIKYGYIYLKTHAKRWE